MLAVGSDRDAGAGARAGRSHGAACSRSRRALLLFSVRAVQYAGTTLFQVKLALIVCGVANALLLRWAIAVGGAQDALRVAPPLRLRVAGALSIALWLAVIVCGRMIAFVD